MTETRLFTRSFWLLTAAHFLQALGYASMILLPLYLAHLDASHAQIGTIMASASVAGLISRPLAGYALDAFGRKPTLVVGTVVLVLGIGLIYFVVDLGPLIFCARILFGVGAGALFSGYFAFSADIIPAARRTEGLALFGVSGLLPLLVNPLSGEMGIAPVDLRWFLPLVGSLILLSLVPLLAVPEPKRISQREPLRLSAVLESLRARNLWSVWLASVVFAGMVGTMMAFVTVTAQKRGIEQPAHLWLTYAAGAIGVRILGARLPDKLGTSNIVVPALACYAFALWLAASAQSASAFFVVGLLGGLGHGYCFPVLASQVASRVPEHYRGSGFAMFTALWVAADLLFTPAFGAFADHFGESAMFTLSACVTCATLFAWLILEHRFGDASPQTS